MQAPLALGWAHVDVLYEPAAPADLDERIRDTIVTRLFWNDAWLVLEPREVFAFRASFGHRHLGLVSGRKD